jgi:DNA-nicking Smr family endonuclease
MTIFANKNEADLFAQEMADVQPLHSEAKELLKQTVTDQPGQLYRRERAAYNNDEQDCPLSLVLRTKLTNDDWLSFKRNGIQVGVFKNLRTGKYTQEATLNLNRKTPQQARDEIVQFVADCEEMNVRSVLLFFGSGESGGQLKSYLAQWLPELESVQAFHTALKHHGGVAAVYVLLRKSEQKRAENKERHAARLGNAR